MKSSLTGQKRGEWMRRMIQLFRNRLHTLDDLSRTHLLKGLKNFFDYCEVAWISTHAPCIQMIFVTHPPGLEQDEVMVFDNIPFETAPKEFVETLIAVSRRVRELEKMRVMVNFLNPCL